MLSGALVGVGGSDFIGHQWSKMRQQVSPRCRRLRKRAVSLRKPLPCDPSAQSALQLLAWCSESLTSHMPSFLEEYLVFETSVFMPWVGRENYPDGVLLFSQNVKSCRTKQRHILDTKSPRQAFNNFDRKARTATDSKQMLAQAGGNWPHHCRSFFYANGGHWFTRSVCNRMHKTT